MSMFSKHTAIVAWSMSKPRTHIQLGFSGTELGAIDFGYLIFYAFGNIFGGKLIDKCSIKCIIGCAASLSGLLYFLVIASSYYTNYALLYVAYFAIIGIVHGPILTGGVKMCDNWFPPKKRGLVMGI